MNRWFVRHRFAQPSWHISRKNGNCSDKESSACRCSSSTMWTIIASTMVAQLLMANTLRYLKRNTPTSWVVCNWSLTTTLNTWNTYRASSLMKCITATSRKTKRLVTMFSRKQQNWKMRAVTMFQPMTWLWRIKSACCRLRSLRVSSSHTQPWKKVGTIPMCSRFARWRIRTTRRRNVRRWVVVCAFV